MRGKKARWYDKTWGIARCCCSEEFPLRRDTHISFYFFLAQDPAHFSFLSVPSTRRQRVALFSHPHFCNTFPVVKRLMYAWLSRQRSRFRDFLQKKVLYFAFFFVENLKNKILAVIFDRHLNHYESRYFDMSSEKNAVVKNTSRGGLFLAFYILIYDISQGTEIVSANYLIFRKPFPKPQNILLFLALSPRIDHFFLFSPISYEQSVSRLLRDSISFIPIFCDSIKNCRG